MTLAERVSEYTKREFESWEANEVLIDDKRAMWSLQKPGSEYRKVCLYRDGKDMFIYGDYGQYTFDDMTWDGSVYNLTYDCLSYQMEKLSRSTKEAINKFHEDACEEDIYEWLRERLENRYELDDITIEKLLNIVKENPDYCDTVLDFSNYCGTVFDWLRENDLSQLENLVCFVYECLANAYEYDWIPFLRNNSDILEEFDEVTGCDLWNAGIRTEQNFFVSLYALQVCKEKLEKEKETEKAQEDVER